MGYAVLSQLEKIIINKKMPYNHDQLNYPQPVIVTGSASHV